MEQRGATSLTVSTLESDPLHPVSETFWSLPAPLTWGQQAKHFQMVLKRTIDLLVASAALILLAIPMSLVMLAIKLDSRGPIFVAQERIGFSGRPFRMYKFRSMVANAEALKAGLLDQNEADAPLFKMRNDPRRTRVGQFIRRFSVDELPQLLNVVQGHMSLVGPRPALLEEAGDPLSPYHAHRVLAVPGLTGLWQVSGRSLLSFEDMVAMDIRYARDWSLWLDLVILARTIPVILSGKGAY